MATKKSDTKAKRSYVRWSEEDRQAVLLNLRKTVAPEYFNKISATAIEHAQEQALSVEKRRTHIPYETVRSFRQYLVGNLNFTAVSSERKPAKYSKKIFVKKVDPPAVPVLSKASTPLQPEAPQEVLPKKAVTIDIQIKDLVKQELRSFKPELLDQVTDRINLLLMNFEKQLRHTIIASEQRMMAYWGAPSVDLPESAGPAKVVPEEVTEPVEKWRFFAADLRSDQHELVKKHLKEKGLDSYVEVVVHDQEQNLRGISGDFFAKAFVFTKFTSHAKETKIVKVFGREKVAKVNGGALSLASAIQNFVDEHGYVPA